MIPKAQMEVDCLTRFSYNSVMNNKVYLDGNCVIVIEVVGDQDMHSVEQMGREVERLITQQRELGKPVMVLDNVLKIGNVGPDARKLVVDLAKRLDYDRLALLGKG